MDAKGQRELAEIKKELQNIINELDSIASGVRNDFTGIGNDTCAACITRAASHYRTVKGKLDKIDTGKVTDEYKSRQGGGRGHGGGGGGGGSW